MVRRDIVVVGASAGGVEALVRLVGGLPADFAGTLFVVLHMPVSGPSALPLILRRAGRLPVTAVEDREKVRPGHIYVSRPDRHLIVEDGWVRALVGPRVNGVRPAIDPLFRSAARAYGRRVIGVVLSGTLDDGAGGLFAIKQRGGGAVVQDPGDALFDGMPRSALARVRVDACVAVSEIPAALARLATSDVAREDGAVSEELEVREDRGLANEDALPPDVSRRAGQASGFTCPECHGSLWEEENGKSVSFGCRVGHTFSLESMIAEQSEAVEAAIWSAINVLEEQAALKRRLAERQGGVGMDLRARFEEQAREAEQQADLIHRVLLRTLRSHQGEMQSAG